MGWTSSYKTPGQSLTEYFINKGTLRWSSDNPFAYNVLDAAFVNLSEFYAAIEMVEKATGIRRVWAAIFRIKLFKEDRSGHNICWKDMDESMGPSFYNCPERILNLLTPTDYESANGWRALCRARIAANAALPAFTTGVGIKLDQPVRFQSGVAESEFIVRQTKGKKIVCSGVTSPGLFRFTRKWLSSMAAANKATFTTREKTVAPAIADMFEVAS